MRRCAPIEVVLSAERTGMALIKKTTDPGRDLTIMTVTGPISADDLIAALTNFYDQGPTGKLVWNFTGAELSTRR